MKPVVIRIVGTQRDASGEEDSVELLTDGKCYVKNGVTYLVYQDSQISGLENSMVTIKLYEQRVVINRSGAVQHKQVFARGERYEGPYITQFGRIEMAVETKELRIAVAQNHSGTVEIEYDLEVNGQWQSANRLSVTIQEDKRHGYEERIADSN